MSTINLSAAEKEKADTLLRTYFSERISQARLDTDTLEGREQQKRFTSVLLRANALNFLRLGADSQDFFEGSRF
jgi:hypothetical protein